MVPWYSSNAGSEQVDPRLALARVNLLLFRHVLRVGQHKRPTVVRVQRAQYLRQHSPHEGKIRAHADGPSSLIRQHFVQKSFFYPESVSRGQGSGGSGHRRFTLLLLQAISYHQERSQAYRHPFRGEDYFDGPADHQQVEHYFSHGEVEPLLRDELDDLDEYVKRRVSRDHSLGALGEE